MFSVLHRIFDRLIARKRELVAFPQIFDHFQELLQDHQKAMELMADLGEKSGGDYIFDRKYLHDSVRDLQILLLRMVKGLNLIASDRYLGLYSALDRVFLPIEFELRGRLRLSEAPYVIPLADAPVDNPELTGGKANTLAEIIHRLHLPVPDGFVITSRGYYRFLEHNSLEDRIHTWIESWISGKENLNKASSQIRYSILAGVVPQDLAKPIKQHAEIGGRNWAVRSSAYGEDGELSFAGLHQTVLNVPQGQILETYKMVLASLYSAEAMSYRLQMGMIGEEAAMPVLCLEMIDSVASGVLRTVDLESPKQDRMAIYASFGLGRTTVEGRDAVDRYVAEKEPPYEITTAKIARKKLLLRPAEGGGEEEMTLSQDQQQQAAISEETVRSLVKWGLALERYFKRPQEIEWAVDSKGNCRLLQCRRLAALDTISDADEDICESCSLYPVLVQDKGVVAHAGVGSGPVRVVQSNEDMDQFPDGAVLVTKYTAPWLARIVPKASAMIAERGSVAGHLATITREFRVPSLIGVENATNVLKNGMEITLDTHHRIIYEGHVQELIRYELVQSTVFEEAPEFRRLRRILKRVAPLHLIDPQSHDFTPEGCESVHDMIRFIHEKAVQELIDLPTFLKRFKGAKVWTLASDLPMGLKILDLGGGLDPFAEGNTVRADQIRSLPLKALWTGVSRPGTWSTEPVAVDLKGLMSSLTRNWDAAGTALDGFNLAVISDIYMNLHLRLGYHFNLIDARMHDEAHHNHIYFRFVGGVTDITRRSRRAQVLADILCGYHFKVTIKGDLVVARILHLPKEEIQRRLQALGRLIGFTRQLDIQLRNDRDIAKTVASFFDQHAEFADIAPIEGVENERKQAQNSSVG
ncbi:MAG: PEP/pyruvate-binding domain-containing protein [Desulfomonilaceae bacterium]